MAEPTKMARTAPRTMSKLMSSFFCLIDSNAASAHSKSPGRNATAIRMVEAWRGVVPAVQR